jgi:SAM-dependent methyltransferase
MNGTIAGDLVRRATWGLKMGIPAARLQPQTTLPESLSRLPPGEARESVLALHKFLGDELPSGAVSIYEAGGGSTSLLPPNLLHHAEITVVDIDAEQLRNNDDAQRKILGDVQSQRFPRNSFDLVICYNVIEHLPDVAAALDRFCEALKDGGLILIGAPNPNSLSGFVTRHTPHWFHVWYYRHVMGKKHAGQPGQPPFQTLFHPLVEPSRLIAAAKARGMEAILRRDYESPRYQEMRAAKPTLAAFIDGVAAILNFALCRTRDVRKGDYHLVLRKR